MAEKWTGTRLDMKYWVIDIKKPVSVVTRNDLESVWRQEEKIELLYCTSSRLVWSIICSTRASEIYFDRWSTNIRAANLAISFLSPSSDWPLEVSRESTDAISVKVPALSARHSTLRSKLESCEISLASVGGCLLDLAGGICFGQSCVLQAFLVLRTFNMELAFLNIAWASSPLRAFAMDCLISSISHLLSPVFLRVRIS